MSRPFTGTHHLVRLILRRDRIRLPLWVAGLTALTGASSAAVQDLYQTPEQIAGYGVTVDSSAAGRFMNGRPYDVDNLGGITSYEISSTAAVLVALMVVFLVVRHTRAEEETGRAELLRATVIGRHAATLAAVIVAAAASVLIGALDAALLVATGLEGAGSLLHGASLAAVGIAFTAIAAAAAQVTSSARAALGIAGGVVGGAFVVRGVGDVGETFVTWLSPFGWAQAIRPFGDPQWWPVAALLLLAAAVFVFTTYLTAHRDAGAGLLQPRPGRPRAQGSLSTSFGLALRLQRGMIIGWAVGLTITAVLFGSFGREVVAMVESNPELGEIMIAEGSSILDGFFAYILAFLAVVASAFSVASVLRLRSEEGAGRAESLLA
ncbi:ABC transporter permease, partial [Nocardioides sp.]|uniref:ABC transporter permease n=1 Tax=Nocardioides sp. TaxID=35761 RepID=UPI002736BD49